MTNPFADIAHTDHGTRIMLQHNTSLGDFSFSISGYIEGVHIVADDRGDDLDDLMNRMISAFNERVQQWREATVPVIEKRKDLERTAREIHCPIKGWMGNLTQFEHIIGVFQQLAEPQRQLLRQLYLDSSIELTVCFPDGRLLEVKRSFAQFGVRNPGEQEWQGTMLNTHVDVVDWVAEAKVELKEE